MSRRGRVSVGTPRRDGRPRRLRGRADTDAAQRGPQHADPHTDRDAVECPESGQPGFPAGSLARDPQMRIAGQRSDALLWRAARLPPAKSHVRVGHCVQCGRSGRSAEYTSSRCSHHAVGLPGCGESIDGQAFPLHRGDEPYLERRDTRKLTGGRSTGRSGDIRSHTNTCLYSGQKARDGRAGISGALAEISMLFRRLSPSERGRADERESHERVGTGEEDR
jgi:hypothetical protein